jgi:hypothetical protein
VVAEKNKAQVEADAERARTAFKKITAEIYFEIPTNKVPEAQLVAEELLRTARPVRERLKSEFGVTDFSKILPKLLHEGRGVVQGAERGGADSCYFEGKLVGVGVNLDQMPRVLSRLYGPFSNEVPKINTFRLLDRVGYPPFVALTLARAGSPPPHFVAYEGDFKNSFPGELVSQARIEPPGYLMFIPSTGKLQMRYSFDFPSEYWKSSRKIFSLTDLGGVELRIWMNGLESPKSKLRTSPFLVELEARWMRVRFDNIPCSFSALKSIDVDYSTRAFSVVLPAAKTIINGAADTAPQPQY